MLSLAISKLNVNSVIGREWRWVVDDASMIVSESVRKHQRLVKQLRGLPGLRLDRWNEAFTVRHCGKSKLQ